MTSENRLQADIFQHHWNHYPKERGLLFHVNNKARNAIEGNKFKAMGVVSGVSDLIYLKPGGKPYLLELKTETGKKSTDQIKWADAVTQAGYNYRVIRSIEEFTAVMQSPKESMDKFIKL
jgi:hypothetical protein